MSFIKRPFKLVTLTLLLVILYWQFFFLGKVPVATDLLVGAYYPWLDHSWGFLTGVPVKNPIISDVFSQFFVWKYLAVDQLKHFELPLWNRYSFSGIPLLETYYSAPFFPFNLILLIPGYLSWGVYIFGQTFLAALGTYFFIKRYIKSYSSQLISVLIFSLGGLMTTWLEFGTGVWANATAPWILLFADNFVDQQRLKYLIGLLFSFICLYLAGNVQLTQFITILFLIRLIFLKINKKSFKLLLPIFLTWIIAVGLVSFQLIPTLAYSPQTIRRVDTPVLGINHDGLNNLEDLIRLSVPDFFGNVTTYNFWGSGSYHEQASFLGVLAIPLLIIVVIKKRKIPEVKFWIGVFIITLVLAFKNPLTVFLYSLQLPLLTYSNASRILFIQALAASILVAYAVEYLELTRENFSKKIFLLFAGGLCLVEVLLKLGAFRNISLDHRTIAFRNTFLEIVLLLIALIGLFLIRHRKYLVLLLLLIFFADLGRYFLKYNPFVSTKIIYPLTPLISYLQSQPKPFRIATLSNETFPANSWTQYRIESIEGYDAMVNERYDRLMNVVNGNPYSGAVSRYADLNKDDSKFLGALNVKYLLDTKRHLEQTKNLKAKVVFSENNSVVLENPNFLPRVFSVTKVNTKETEHLVGEYINRPEFDPANEAVVETKENLAKSYTQVKANISEYGENSMSFGVDSNQEGFIVISDNFINGWHLTEDSKSKKLYRVDGSLMGFIHLPGQHRYHLYYLPESIKIGGWLSLLSLLVGLGLTFFGLSRKIISLK